MILYLTSSPCVPGADRAILNPANGFLDRLRADLPERPKCLVVCADPNSFAFTDQFAWDMAGAFGEAGMPWGELRVLDGRNPLDARDLVEWSQLIILAGGHVPTQNRFFREIGLAGFLRDYPGTVIGVSAGSMNSAAMVYSHPELRGEAVDPNYQRFLPGLGLTYINIVPHFQQIRDLRLDGLLVVWDIALGDSRGHCFYALPDGTYFYTRDGKTLLCGEAYRMEENHFYQVCREGETLAL